MEDVPQTRWARTADAACIAYQDLGDGPVTLLVVHGWVSHLEVYWEQPRYARFMRRLSRNLRVLAFDKRGVGMSDRVTGGAPDLGILADDARAVGGVRLGRHDRGLPVHGAGGGLHRGLGRTRRRGRHPPALPQGRPANAPPTSPASAAARSPQGSSKQCIEG